MCIIPFLGPTCYAHLVLTPPGCVYHFMVLGSAWCAYLVRAPGCVYHFTVLGPTHYVHVVKRQDACIISWFSVLLAVLISQSCLGKLGT